MCDKALQSFIKGYKGTYKQDIDQSTTAGGSGAAVS